MDAIKHATTSLKEKVTGHHELDHNHDAHVKAPGAEKAPHEPRAAVAAAHSDPPTDGHAQSHKAPPGAPGIIETPAPGVVATGTQGPGLNSTYLPRS